MSDVEVETSQVPPGARCAAHPSAEAIAICARCGSYACRACTRAKLGRAYCDACAGDVLPPLASAGRRFVAATLDSLFVMVPMVLCAMASLDGLNDEGGPGVNVAFAVAGGVGLLAVLAGNAVLVARYGQSLAKRLLAIRVVRPDGSQATFWRIALLRNVVPGMIGNVPIVGGLFALTDACFIFRDDRRCIHDLLADTIVVEVPPR